MDTHPGTIEKTFVQLKTAPISGNGTLQFYAKMTDASNGNFEDWGFFYKQSILDTAPSSTNKDDTVDADHPATDPPNTPETFTHTADKPLPIGKKHYFNAFLGDETGPTDYIYQNPGAEATAPTGISFTIPDVTKTTTPLPFAVTLEGKLTGDHDTAPWDDTAFPRVEAGFKWRVDDVGPWINITSADSGGGWNEGPPLSWSATIIDLSNNQQIYESYAWMEVKSYNSIGVDVCGNVAPTIVINSQTLDFSTLHVDVPLVSKNWFNPTGTSYDPSNNGWHTQVQVVFFPDDVGNEGFWGDGTAGDMTTASYASSRDKTKPIEVHFRGLLDQVGDDNAGGGVDTHADEVGFFISKVETTTKPDYNTQDFTFSSTNADISLNPIDGLDPGQSPTLQVQFKNKVLPSATKHDGFPVPGQEYYVNAYAKCQTDSSGDIFYYADGDQPRGADGTSDDASGGNIFQIPHVWMSDASCATIVEAGVTSEKGEVKFEGVILARPSYPGAWNGGASQLGKRGFFYWSAAGQVVAQLATPAANDVLYPGKESTQQVNPQNDADRPDLGPCKIIDSWDQIAGLGVGMYNNTSIKNLKWATNYWVRAYVQDDNQGVGGTSEDSGMVTVFYATPKAGNLTDVERCTWLPAQKFYIPAVGTTPTATAFTTDSFTIPTMSLDETPNLYDKKPPIKEKGYYVWLADPPDPTPSGKRVTQTDDTKTWLEVVIGDDGDGGSPLTHNTTYNYVAFADVYVSEAEAAIDGATFEIISPDTKTATTLEKLEVSNTPTTGANEDIRIGVSAANLNLGTTADVCYGAITTTSAPFQYIAVLGQVINGGGLDEVGFFIDDANHARYDAAHHIGHFRNMFPAPPPVAFPQDYLLAAAPSGFEIVTNPFPLELAKDYWVNFYASDTNAGTLDNDYIYENAQPTTGGTKFKIPEVLNNSITYSQGTGHAGPSPWPTVFPNQLIIHLEGDVNGTKTDFQSDASGFGFVWIEDSLVGGGDGDHKVFPHLETGSSTSWEELDTTKDWDDLQGGGHFEYDITTVDQPADWAKKYYVNAFVRDRFKGQTTGATVVTGSGQNGREGIVYYPLEPNNKVFIIPKPETGTPTNVRGYKMTLQGSMPIGENEYDAAVVVVKSYGFYIKEDTIGGTTNIPWGTPPGDEDSGATVEVEVGSGTGAPAGGTWEEEVGDIGQPGPPNAFIGIQGLKAYHIRAYIKIGANGGSGTPDITLFGDEIVQNTPPAVPDVSNCFPIVATFITNNKIKLCGNFYRDGTGDHAAVEVGFFISRGDGVNTEAPAAGVGNHDWASPGQSPPAVGADFEYDFDYSTPDPSSGQIFYFNPYIKTEPDVGVFEYYYANLIDQTVAPIGQTFTIPKVENDGLKLESVESVTNDGSFTVEFTGDILTPPKINDVVPDNCERGFYILEGDTNPPSNGNNDFSEDEDLTAGGEFSLSISALNKKKDYYFNTFLFDGGTYHYEGGVVPGPGIKFNIPDVGVNNPITDISGDAVQLDASHTPIEYFTVTERGFFIDYAPNEPPNEPNTKVISLANTSPWSVTVDKPIDILDSTLGGDAQYNTNAFITIDEVDISGVAVSFRTPKWPVFQYLDISRNVGVQESRGYIQMIASVSDDGAGNAAFLGAGVMGSQIGFYIGTDPKPKSGGGATVINNVLESGTFSVYEALEEFDSDDDYIEEQDSSKNDVFLKRGVTYYTNVAISQDSYWTPDASNTQYYGFTPNSDPALDPSGSTFARGTASPTPGTFPDGISFIIPDVRNEDPEIIDSSTVKLKLCLDSSGDTVDVPGTNRLGFFLNHSTESWADASCNEEAYQVGHTLDLDLPTISVATPMTVEEGASSSSHDLQNPHIFSNIVTFSSTTNRKIIINVSSWRVLITPDASGISLNPPIHGVDERVVPRASDNAVDLVNPTNVEVQWSDSPGWHSCAPVVSASGDVWNDASNGIWYAARKVGNSFWEIDAASSSGNIDVKVEWARTDEDFALWFGGSTVGAGFSDNGYGWDRQNNPPFRVTSAKVIVTAIEDVPLVEVENGMYFDSDKTLSVADSSVILSSITYSNEDTPNATWTGLDGHAELDQTPPNDGYSVKHTHSYADKIFATGSSVTFGLGSTPTTEPTGVNDLDASASIYVYYKNSDTPTVVYDISKVLIPEMDPWSPTNTNKIKNDYFLDASGLIAGRNYYYTGYTALLPDDHDGYDSNDEPLRGESVDGDDYWYPPGYISEDSTNIVKRFCIGDSSCNNLSSDSGTKTDTTTKLHGKTFGNLPFPYDNEHGFVYWFDGSKNYDNRQFLETVPAPANDWPEIELTGLKDSTRYYALPYFKQGDNYIYGGFDRTTSKNHPTIWYTDLVLCEASLNDKGSVELGNNNNGSPDGEGLGDLAGDASGSQTRYKLLGIDASLNKNPPNNFEMEDLSGTVVELGLCWKVTNEPIGSPAEVTDLSKNLIDGSYNAWKDVNQTGPAPYDVFRDASFNIYDASINDLSYNKMYSLRTFVKNEPIIDDDLIASAQQRGDTVHQAANGYAYSSEVLSFITPLPKVLIEDPSAAQIPLGNALNENSNIPGYAPNIITKIGISGEILDNPDEASGNIIEYGFLMKMFEANSGALPPVDYDSFDNENCDISTNLLGGGLDGRIFYPDNLIDTSFNISGSSPVPYKFFQSLSLYPEGGVKDLSYNRQYYFGSYARNMSDYYLMKGETGDYINTDGITSYKKFNDASAVFITPWPKPFIQIKSLEKPASLTGASAYTYVNVSLEIFNYDPTEWGGIAEFGVLWETNSNLQDSQIDLAANYDEPNAFTMQYMDGSGGWLSSTDGSGGWYRRGCSGEIDFGEQAGEGHDEWFWGTTPAGWIYDASFSSGGLPDGNENASCRWPPGSDNYVKLGVYQLGAGGSPYPSDVETHKFGPGGEGSAQDPSSIPFNTENSYWLRPYIITRNQGFWKPPDENGNPRDDSGVHPDSSFNIFYGPPKNLTFDLDLVGIETGHTKIDENGDPTLINWSDRGYTGDGGGSWESMEDVKIDGADMSGNIVSNPLIGNPIRGRIIKYGFLWWDGGKTAGGSNPEALQWPGKDFGITPETAAGVSVPNLGFTLANINWPPDGSNNYCVDMSGNTQGGTGPGEFGWNVDSGLGGENQGRSTFDLSGTSFDISANDFDRSKTTAYGAGGGTAAHEAGYYWDETFGAENSGWYDIPFPKENPPWPGGGGGPNGEPAVVTSSYVIFDVKETSREGTKNVRLFNSTVWYRAYAINSFFDPNSGNEAQLGYSYGTVGRLELKRSVSFGVNMINPVLVSTNIGSRSILVRGSLLGNEDGQGLPIVENYGFCWRKLIENHPWREYTDENGETVTVAQEQVPSWFYNKETASWEEEIPTPSFPPPTVIDSSMVALGLRSDGKIWDNNAENLALDVEYSVNKDNVTNFGANGEFPGEPELIGGESGFTQNPPPFKFGEREWNFHYKIGSDGEELEAEGGVKDPNFVGFDASGGKPISNTYYLIRSWVKGPIDPGTTEDDHGETASGIKYGPLWYINANDMDENKQKGWLALTKSLERCSLSDIIVFNKSYKSVTFSCKLLTNPDPTRLIKYGFVFMVDDGHGTLPSIEKLHCQHVLIDNPENVGDVPPAKDMEKKIGILPNTTYIVRAFADNSFKSYISYDISGVGLGLPTPEGGISYSSSATFKSGFCPPPASRMITVTDVSFVSVELVGDIYNNYNGLISKYGFVVSEESIPVHSNSIVYDLGSKNDMGYYTFFATGLKYNTTYFVRSFAYHPEAREDLRLKYSTSALTFQTLNPDPPQIGSTKMIVNRASGTSAVFESEFLETFGVELITSYGFCWTTRISPLSGKQWDPGNVPNAGDLTIENADFYSENTNFNDSFPVSFKIDLKNLQPSTTYYIRSYAKINPIGYGEVLEFTTRDLPCDCIPPTTKPIGALQTNKSSKMLCAEVIKRHGSAIIGTRGVTPNLL